MTVDDSVTESSRLEVEKISGHQIVRGRGGMEAADELGGFVGAVMGTRA